MNSGTELLLKIKNKAESMTIEEYEELFDSSEIIENIDIVNIEIKQSLFLKPTIYSNNVYDSFIEQVDFYDNVITDYKKADLYEIDRTFLMVA